MYKEIVSSERNSFQAKELYKLAGDLACLLDEFTLKLSPDPRNYTYLDIIIAKKLEVIFHDFSAVCCLCNVREPVLDPRIYQAFFPRSGSQIDKEILCNEFLRYSKQCMNQTGDVKKDDENYKILESLLSVWSLVPTAFVFGVEGIQAMINHQLILLGKDPVRPDYFLRLVKSVANADVVPFKLFKILVVDHDYISILETMRSLSGWENICSDYLFINYDIPTDRLVGSITSKIVSYNPDAILIDIESGILGCEVFNTCQKSKEKIIFVANTLYEQHELSQAGVFSSFQKGRDSVGLTLAIESWNRSMEDTDSGGKNNENEESLENSAQV